MDGETDTITGLYVKAFVGWSAPSMRPVVTPVAAMEEARRLFDSYVENPNCDAAYIYEGERIVDSWSESYDRYMASSATDSLSAAEGTEYEYDDEDGEI